MIAREVMMECPVTLRPDSTVAEALAVAVQSELDILPVVDESGRYQGAVRKSSLVDHAGETRCRVRDLCCADALVCRPDFAVEHLSHDSSSTVPHRTLIVVDEDGRFRGVVPQVHWAIDEARAQSGHPRSPLEVRTYTMHLVYRCLSCGWQTTRNDGIPGSCPHCGADPSDMALHTED
ncbi:MAG: CBS domain-containing protein [Alicyclobacillaceae bacterium]|nr:CBS domain-containing protein [Alicyclobacillaceae bacterium]